MVAPAVLVVNPNHHNKRKNTTVVSPACVSSSVRHHHKGGRNGCCSPPPLRTTQQNNNSNNVVFMMKNNRSNPYVGWFRHAPSSSDSSSSPSSSGSSSSKLSSSAMRMMMRTKNTTYAWSSANHPLKTTTRTTQAFNGSSMTKSLPTPAIGTPAPASPPSVSPASASTATATAAATIAAFLRNQRSRSHQKKYNYHSSSNQRLKRSPYVGWFRHSPPNSRSTNHSHKKHLLDLRGQDALQTLLRSAAEEAVAACYPQPTARQAESCSSTNGDEHDAGESSTARLQGHLSSTRLGEDLRSLFEGRSSTNILELGDLISGSLKGGCDSDDDAEAERRGQEFIRRYREQQQQQQRDSTYSDDGDASSPVRTLTNLALWLLLPFREPMDEHGVHHHRGHGDDDDWSSSSDPSSKQHRLGSESVSSDDDGDDDDDDDYSDDDDEDDDSLLTLESIGERRLRRRRRAFSPRRVQPMTGGGRQPQQQPAAAASSSSSILPLSSQAEAYYAHELSKRLMMQLTRAVAASSLEASDAANATPRTRSSSTADGRPLLPPRPLSLYDEDDDDASRLDYVITQMDIVRMNQTASRHLDVESIMKLPVVTYQRRRRRRRRGKGRRNNIRRGQQQEEHDGRYKLEQKQQHQSTIRPQQSSCNSSISSITTNNSQNNSNTLARRKETTTNNTATTTKPEEWSWMLVDSTMNHGFAAAAVDSKDHSNELKPTMRSDVAEVSSSARDTVPSAKDEEGKNQTEDENSCYDGSDDVVNGDHDDDDDLCVICLEQFIDGERLRMLPCGHLFHVGCIDRWLSGSRSFHHCITTGCPTCKRRPIQQHQHHDHQHYEHQHQHDHQQDLNQRNNQNEQDGHSDNDDNRDEVDHRPRPVMFVEPGVAAHRAGTSSTATLPPAWAFSNIGDALARGSSIHFG